MERSDYNPFNENLYAKLDKYFQGDNLEFVSAFLMSLSENNELNDYFERNQDLNSADELIVAVRAKQPGDSVKLLLSANGSKRTVAVVLAASSD